MITWTQQPDKPQVTSAGVKWVARRWEGKVAKIPDAVWIQGPTPHNKSFRVMAVMRWKDAVTADCDTLELAQSCGEAMVSKWLEDSGLQVAA